MISFSLPTDSSGSSDTFMSVQDAATYSGYNAQYLRRLLVSGDIEGSKIGQVWLVKVTSLDAYLKEVRQGGDRRYGPRVYHEFVEEHDNDSKDTAR